MTRWILPSAVALAALVPVSGFAQGTQKPLVVETAHTHEFAGPLAELFASSALVAKVVIDDARVVPAPDGHPTLDTDYTCRVLEVFRGDAAVGGEVMVRREGGLREETTRWRRLAIKGFPDFVKGAEYVLFLWAAPIEGYFFVDRGGAYKIEEGVVRAFGQRRAAASLDAMAESWVLDRLRKMRAQVGSSGSRR